MDKKEFIDFVNNAGLYSLDAVLNVYSEQSDKSPKYVMRQNMHCNECFSSATDIYRCKDGFVGVFGIVRVYDNNSDVFPCYAEEFMARSAIVYIPKSSL